MKEFIKKHTHALINVFGVILLVLIAIPSEISLYWLLTIIFIFKYPFILLLLLISNIIAFKSIKNDKKVLAIVFSALFGSIGGFIAVNESDVTIKRTVKIIFQIHMWITAVLICGSFSGVYYAGSHF